MTIEIAATTEVQEIWDAITSGRVSYSTYVALQAAISRPFGSIAEVQGDTGSHTDPVSSTTVTNNGVYRRVDAGWEWLTATAADTLTEATALLAELEAASSTYDLTLRHDLLVGTGGMVGAPGGKTALDYFNKVDGFIEINLKDEYHTGDADYTPAFARAKAKVLALRVTGPNNPNGGRIKIPAGDFIFDGDLSTNVYDDGFEFIIEGAGRNATRWIATSGGGAMCNILGRSRFELRNIALISGGKNCAIYACREVTANLCNHGRLKDVDFIGNFSSWANVFCGTEQWSVENCRYILSTANGPWFGTDPAKIGFTPSGTGTPRDGTCTANVEVGCETYILTNGAMHRTFSTNMGGVGWSFYRPVFIGGSGNNQKFNVYKDPVPGGGGVGGIFNGEITFLQPHYELFGTTGAFHYLEAGSITGGIEWHGIKSLGGAAVCNDNVAFLDWDRANMPTVVPQLYECEFTIPTLSPGLSSGLPIYLYSATWCEFKWKGRGNNGTIVALGTIDTCPNVQASNSYIVGVANSIITTTADSVPTTGTYPRGYRFMRTYNGGAPAIGDATSWIVTTSGSYGTLSGVTATTTVGSNHVTSVSSTAGLYPGQLISIGGTAGTNINRIAKVGIGELWLTANVLAGGGVTGGAVQYYPGGSMASFTYQLAPLGLSRAAAPTTTYAAPSGGTTIDSQARASLAQLAADFADYKAKALTANQTA